MNTNKLVIAVVLICAIFTGYVAYTRPVTKDVPNNVGSASTGPASDSPFQSVNGVETYTFNTSMAATSSDVCTIMSPWPTSTSTLLQFTALVSANTMGAAYVDLSTTTQASTTNASTGVTAINATFGSSSPALVKGYQLTSSAASALGLGSLVWTPIASTTGQFASGGWVIAGNGVPNGSSAIILSPFTAITLRVASSSTVVGQLTGRCQGVIQKL